MAFTRVLYTSLAVWGGPGPASAPLAESGTVTDTVSVSVTEVAAAAILNAVDVTDTVSVSLSETANLLSTELNLYRTQLRVFGPGPYIDIGDKASVTVADISASDTLSVQWLEEPVDSNEIVSADTLRVTLAETSQLLNHLAVVDTASVSLSETVALVQAGVTVKTGTDTLSVTLTEASAVNVTVSVTDTVSVSVTDASVLLTPTQFITGSDTLSVSATEDTPLLGIFTGILDVLASDTLTVGVLETANMAVFDPPVVSRPFRIRIVPRTARIRIVAQ
jgi:hypothetical protein